jgi:hypothetical protein
MQSIKELERLIKNQLKRKKYRYFLALIVSHEFTPDEIKLIEETIKKVDDFFDKQFNGLEEFTKGNFRKDEIERANITIGKKSQNSKNKDAEIHNFEHIFLPETISRDDLAHELAHAVWYTFHDKYSKNYRLKEWFIQWERWFVQEAGNIYDEFNRISLTLIKHRLCKLEKSPSETFAELVSFIVTIDDFLPKKKSKEALSLSEVIKRGIEL